MVTHFPNKKSSLKKILIVVTLTMKVDRVVVRFIVFITVSAEAS